MLCRYADARARPPKPSKSSRTNTARPQDASFSGVRGPTGREMLIARWRRITELPLPLPLPGAAGCNRPAGAYRPAEDVAESPDDGGNLLATCELLLRRRLRQDWALLHSAGRAQVLTWVGQVKRDTPVLKATFLAADAAAWTLFAMYWWGASHPGALFNRSLHPPTGLVRWISQFGIDQQGAHAREIPRRFAHHMGSTRDRCDVLVHRMLRRKGSVAFLRELCDF